MESSNIVDVDVDPNLSGDEDDNDNASDKVQPNVIEESVGVEAPNGVDANVTEEGVVLKLIMGIL
ncbi:hypothetical protein SLEP1_g37087 [Rubroshorea leprosula]|uniref:Uncharacterized protein n=1 Tax=Rubroshorea leprosula TaxID=152421 RepID=A0AAV5KTQ6_9ROSI|nr:hypothetical protein SLEP1_g37087 [Rubroshorea leprosula]